MNVIAIVSQRNGTQANPDYHSAYSFVFPVACLHFLQKLILFPWHLSTYKFVTHEDVCSAFNGDTLLVVVAPSGTQLDVPLPEMVVKFTSMEESSFILPCTKLQYSENSQIYICSNFLWS